MTTNPSSILQNPHHHPDGQHWGLGDDHSQNTNNALSVAGVGASNSGASNSRVGHHSQGPTNNHKLGSKLKLGANTSTNFMKSVNQNPSNFNVQMLRQVKQNLPNVSLTLLFNIFYYLNPLIQFIHCSLKTAFVT